MSVDYAALKAKGFMIQKQKDFFSLRLKVVGGNVTTERLKTIVEVANRYGSGRIHLTSRQGIEIPNIRLEDIEIVEKTLAAGGVSLGASGPRVRAVTACQGGRVCPSGCVDAYEIAEELDRRYFGRTLPHKFKFGVTGCPNNCLKAEENDFGIKGVAVPSCDGERCVECGACARACARRAAISFVDHKPKIDREGCSFCGKCAKACPKGVLSVRSGYLVSIGGTFGNEIRKGKTTLPIIFERDVLFRVADSALSYFARNAKPKERFAALLERKGWNELQSELTVAIHGQENEPR